MGTVTVSHFSRVLRFMKIPLSDKDFLLLLKRYMKDSYMVNYVAFMKHIENILDYLKSNKLTDNSMVRKSQSLLYSIQKKICIPLRFLIFQENNTELSGKVN